MVTVERYSGYKEYREFAFLLVCEDILLGEDSGCCGVDVAEKVHFIHIWIFLFFGCFVNVAENAAQTQSSTSCGVSNVVPVKWKGFAM